MKKIFLLILPLIILNHACALEPFKIKNPDVNTKIEFTLDRNAQNFSLDTKIFGAQAVNKDFEIILCYEHQTPLKRAKLNHDGTLSFGSLKEGRYFLKFNNIPQAHKEKPQDKAAPYIMNLPYIKEKGGF